MASATRSAARPSSSRLSSSNRRGGGTPTWITPVTSSPAVSGTEITDPMPRIAGADRSSSGGSCTSSGARESATRAATCWSRATTRSAGSPARGGAQDQLARALLGQEDRRRLGRQDLAQPRDQQLQDLLQAPVGQRGVQQHLQALDHLGHVLGLLAGRLLAEELLALALALGAVAQVAHEHQQDVLLVELHEAQRDLAEQRACRPCACRLRSPRSGGSSGEVAKAACSRSKWPSRSSGRMITSTTCRPTTSSAV